MGKLLYVIGTVIVVGLSSANALKTVGVRAPARLTIEDCLCQCESQVFVDKYGRTNGNCKSVDSTGKQWCYLKDVEELIGTYRKGHCNWNGFTTVRAASPVSTTCPDGKTSQQFQGKVYGYLACGTPELNDRRCQELLYGSRPPSRPTSRPTVRPPYRPTARPPYRPTTNRPCCWAFGSNKNKGNKKKGATRTQSADNSAVKFVQQ